MAESLPSFVTFNSKVAVEVHPTCKPFATLLVERFLNDIVHHALTSPTPSMTLSLIQAAEQVSREWAINYYNNERGMSNDTPPVLRPRSAFEIFSVTFEPDVRKTNPASSPKTILAKVSKAWERVLSNPNTQEKELYEQMEADELLVYKARSEIYASGQPPVVRDPLPVATKTKKPRADPNAPKRPSTAYMFYCKDIRPTVHADNPEMSFGELGTAIAARWAKATQEEKRKYAECAARDKERYERAMASYTLTKRI